MAREAHRLEVDLGDQRTSGVDGTQAPPLGVRPHRGRDPVGAEHDRAALGHVVEILDEARAARLELLDDEVVVDDLVPHVDGRPVEVDRQIDHVDRPVHSRAIAAGSGEPDLGPGRRGGGAHK